MYFILVSQIFSVLSYPVNFVWNWFYSIVNGAGLYNFLIYSIVAALVVPILMRPIRGGSAGLSTRTLFRDRSEPSSKKEKK